MTKHYFFACFRFLCLSILVSAIAFFSVVNPAASKNLADCAANQESFGFLLKEFPVEHQGYALFNIDVTYRINTPIETIDPKVYPDYVEVSQEVEKFLVEYPNESDYWEIMNKKLAIFLLNTYPSLSSIQIKIDVMPTTPKTKYERFSEVLITRPDSCPLLVGS
ncbi:MAG: hypothetical protein ACOYMP_11070 [Nodosilinea sp.]